MTNGVYGNIKSAIFDPSRDAEIWISYQKDRETTSDYSLVNNTTDYLETVDTVDGLYRLKLPMNNENSFNRIGFHNIYIRPKRYEVNVNIGRLTNNPNIEGLIVSDDGLPDGLTGYMISYEDGKFLMVTSSNKCEIDGDGYKLNSSGGLIFLTVTPSSIISEGNVILSNTLFNPEMIEIEVVEHDIDSVYSIINGNQVRNIETNEIDTYDKKGNLVNKVAYFEFKESETGKPIYEVRYDITNTDEDINSKITELIDKYE